MEETSLECVVSIICRLIEETICFSLLGAQWDTLVYIYSTAVDVLQPWASFCSFMIVLESCCLWSKSEVTTDLQFI